MKYRYLIWDFGNTLCATYPAMAQALQGVLRVEGIDAPVEPILDLMHRTLLSDCIATIARQHDLDLDPFKTRLLNDYAAMPLAEQRPYSGVVAILERVLENGGKNFLFTHRGCKTLTEALRVHDLARFFTEALSTQDGYPRKPDPGAFNYLIDTYALPREQTLCRGDHDNHRLAVADQSHHAHHACRTRRWRLIHALFHPTQSCIASRYVFHPAAVYRSFL